MREVVVDPQEGVWWGWGSASLVRAIRGSHPEKLIFESRSEPREEAHQENVQGEEYSSHGKSRSKGPEAEMSRASSQSRKQASRTRR